MPVCVVCSVQKDAVARLQAADIVTPRMREAKGEAEGGGSVRPATDTRRPTSATHYLQHTILF